MIVFGSSVQNYFIFGLFRMLLFDKFTRFNIENELYEIPSKREPAKIVYGNIHVQHTKILQIRSFLSQ